MKIGVSCSVDRSAGGLFFAVSSLCKALHARGAEVSVFGADRGFGEEDRAVWNPVPVETYRAYGPLGTSFRFRGMLEASGAQLVHQHGLWLDDQWAASQWQKRTGRPLVISPHGMLDPWALRNSAWKKQLVRRLFADESLRRTTCIHALCRSELESIRACGLRNPVAVVPNGVELPDLRPETAPADSQPPVRRLLFLGRIHPKKGLRELLEAWSRTQAPWRSEWRLVIAGWDDGGYEEGLKGFAREHGLAGSVEFAGPCFGGEKDALLRSAGAFILPSFSEGLPMSVLEAWSYGLPVVMTGFCNLPEGFAAEAALRIEPTPQSIADGLDRLAALSRDERLAMGRRGRGLVEREFSWPTIAQRMLSVYEWCMAGGGLPSCMELER